MNWSENRPNRGRSSPSSRNAALESKQYAAYDSSGNYIGQRIPFSLTPRSALGGDAMGIPDSSEVGGCVGPEEDGAVMRQEGSLS